MATSESKIGWPYYHQTVPSPGNLSASLMNVHMISKYPGSQHIKGRSEMMESEKNTFCTWLTAEFASRLAPLAEVDKLDGARMSEQVKSQSKGKPRDQGINDMPSGLLPSLRHTPTGSKTAGHQSATNSFIHCSVPRNTASTTPARQTLSSKNINFTATNTRMLDNDGNTET